MQEKEMDYGDTHDSSLSGKNPWRDLPALCDNLVADGVINHAEAAILRQWLSADRWSKDNNDLARIDYLVSKLLSEKRISIEERRELFNWLES